MLGGFREGVGTPLKNGKTGGDRAEARPRQSEHRRQQAHGRGWNPVRPWQRQLPALCVSLSLTSLLQDLKEPGLLPLPLHVVIFLPSEDKTTRTRPGWPLGWPNEVFLQGFGVPSIYDRISNQTHTRQCKKCHAQMKTPYLCGRHLLL